jgi:HSP20 family molecular chaperone IbpA
MNKETLIETYNNKIRRQYYQNSGEWLFSVVDVIGVATKSSDSRNYWKVLKNRLKKTQNELVTACNQLKMEAPDGKYYLTDTAPASTILKILSLVSEESIPSFEAYFASLGRPKSENIVSLLSEKFEPKKATLNLNKNTVSSYPQEDDENTEFMISVDIYRKKNSLILEAFVAGVSLSDLIIVTTSQTISIKGHRNLAGKVNDENYQIQEISWGKFSRVIELPYEIDINKIEATDERGLITIEMPMIDKSYTRRLKVKSL